MKRRLCPALLGYLGRHARGMLWRLAGQSRPGLYVSPPYVTGEGSPPLGGFPPLPCSEAFLRGEALR